MFYESYLDQSLSTTKAVALCKRFRQIGITFTPSSHHQKQIKKHWKEIERRQSQQAIQSELNDEPFQFPISEEFDGWTDELFEIAFDAVIEKDIFIYKPIFRGPIFQSIIDNDLVVMDERFQGLPMTNLRDTFYNKHNIIVKKRDMNGNLVGDDVKQWELKLNDYINKTGILQAITSLDSDQGYVLILYRYFYSVFSNQVAYFLVTANICLTILGTL